MISLRNKELRRVIIFSIIIVLGFTLISLIFDQKFVFLLFLQGICLLIIFLSFSLARYRQIKKLSTYLARVRQGEPSLDIRDNQEGELSILKNEIYKVTSMLSEYNERLIKDKAQLADHMADISHQLKTPLTSMMVMTDLLRDDDLPAEKRKEFVTKISSQLERIEWLVTSLLTISKLDAGVIEMKLKDVVSKDLIEASLEPLLITLELRDISYSLIGGENIIHCDKHWTREAIINILKNCIEHTSLGGKLSIVVNDNPLYSEIIIRDTGSGIHKDDLAYIFTRFYRGKNSSKDSVGIGLSMSKSIIQSQGGDISVESQVGKGSTFRIKLYKTVV
ncbi:MAG: HAMP domain-containing histidine kinase [Clostridiales bacterium]|nr:HAMP domain-containing histidine kinase [Clostridiales bacterium]